MACVMIVDDDEQFASAVALALQGAGHEAEIALDIPTAISAMEDAPPDLVILDVMFPENYSAGFELARSMRNSAGRLQRIPIIMLTAVNDRFPLGFSSRDIDDYRLPVAAFLEKPVDLDFLARKVRDILKGAASYA